MVHSRRCFLGHAPSDVFWGDSHPSELWRCRKQSVVRDFSYLRPLEHPGKVERRLVRSITVTRRAMDGSVTGIDKLGCVVGRMLHLEHACKRFSMGVSLLTALSMLLAFIHSSASLATYPEQSVGRFLLFSLLPNMAYPLLFSFWNTNHTSHGPFARPYLQDSPNQACEINQRATMHYQNTRVSVKKKISNGYKVNVLTPIPTRPFVNVQRSGWFIPGRRNSWDI
jgi:hypothetical protein